MNKEYEELDRAANSWMDAVNRADYEWSDEDFYLVGQLITKIYALALREVESQLLEMKADYWKAMDKGVPELMEGFKDKMQRTLAEDYEPLKALYKIESGSEWVSTIEDDAFFSTEPSL